MKAILLLFIIISIKISLSAQEVLTLQPSSITGKDAEIFTLEPNSNIDQQGLRGNAWTFEGLFGVQRGFIQFDLSSIPRGSKVDSAFLSLYSPGFPNTQTQSGNNAAFLKRVTSNWSEKEITWNLQPSVTETNRVTLPSSSSGYQDYTDIDVTKLVNDMVNDSANSFGFRLSLQNESRYNRISFASSDHGEKARHPKLVVYYSPVTCTSLVLQPGNEGKDAEIFNLQPTSTFNDETFRGNAWTFSGVEGVVRGLLEFDPSAIPANVEINSAYLTLYSPEEGHSQFHSGDNAGVLHRITSAWNENTVNWNNQPSTSSTNEVLLHASEFKYQDYRNVDVTNMIKDMVENPSGSFGMMLMLQNETIYRRLSFASGDYFNKTKHPRLEVCYTSKDNINSEPCNDPNVIISPNPFTTSVHIDASVASNTIRLEIFSILGLLLYNQVISNNSTVVLPELPPNAYIFKITDCANRISTFKMIRQ